MIEWAKYGFVEDMEAYGWFRRKDFPFEVLEHDGFLRLELVDPDNKNRTINVSLDNIPATNQAIVLLLKAFNLPKL